MHNGCFTLLPQSLYCQSRAHYFGLARILRLHSEPRRSWVAASSQELLWETASLSHTSPLRLCYRGQEFTVNLWAAAANYSMPRCAEQGGIGAEPIPRFSSFPTALGSARWQMDPCPLVFILLDVCCDEPGQGTVWEASFLALSHCWVLQHGANGRGATIQNLFTYNSGLSRWIAIFILRSQAWHTQKIKAPALVWPRAAPWNQGTCTCSSRGTRLLLGGSLAPTQGGTTLANSCFSCPRTSVLVPPGEVALLTIYCFLN